MLHYLPSIDDNTSIFHHKHHRRPSIMERHPDCRLQTAEGGQKGTGRGCVEPVMIGRRTDNRVTPQRTEQALRTRRTPNPV
jgi:hypothetical protein